MHPLSTSLLWRYLAKELVVSTPLEQGFVRIVWVSSDDCRLLWDEPVSDLVWKLAVNCRNSILTTNDSNIKIEESNPYLCGR